MCGSNTFQYFQSMYVESWFCCRDWSLPDVLHLNYHIVASDMNNVQVQWFGCFVLSEVWADTLSLISLNSFTKMRRQGLCTLIEYCVAWKIYKMRTKKFRSLRLHEKAYYLLFVILVFGSSFSAVTGALDISGKHIFLAQVLRQREENMAENIITIPFISLSYNIITISGHYCLV